MPLPANFPIQTPRLQLRTVIQSDLPDLLKVNSNPRVTDFLPYDTWHTPADAQAWFERTQTRCADGNGIQLVVALNAPPHTVIGTAILFAHDAESGRVELGYVLGEAHWGQGFAREAVGHLVRHCFAQMGIRRIEAQINPANTASCKLVEALGFTLEGHLRNRYTAKGRTYGVNLYAKLASD
jgi:[ribosomal protein S5]-alanine N-acetyltransferase